jgi:hypothetical protein
VVEIDECQVAFMTPNEEKRFRDSGRQVPEKTILRLATTADGRSSDVSQFCERLSVLIPQVSVLREDAPGQDYPFMHLPNGVRYMGIPAGNEVGAFVEALSGKVPALPAPLRARVASVRYPAGLDLYIMPRCTVCPQAVRRLMPLPAANPLIRLTVIDGVLFPELAQRDCIQTVPTAVLDGRFRWSGAIELENVITLLTTRDPASLGPASLAMMLKEGAARKLAEMMVEQNGFFPAILDLLCDDTWPVRLAAMVATEELYALQPALARELLEHLWRRFDAVSDTVKGDILYLAGEIGGTTALEKITRVLAGTAAADVLEAAAEAVEKLK